MVNRNTPTLTNVAYNNSFMLDGVNPSLENQAIVPFHEKNEFDLHILIAADRDSDYGFINSSIIMKIQVLLLFN